MLPRERSMRYNIIQVYLWVWRYKSVIPFELRIQLFPECRSLCHLAYIKFTLLFWRSRWFPLSHFDVGSWYICATKVQCIWIAAFVTGLLLRLSRACCCVCHWHVAVIVVESQRRSASIVQPSTFDPVDCWSIIALIICYILHKCLILSSHSLKHFTLMSVCVSNCFSVTVMYKKSVGLFKPTDWINYTISYNTV